MRHRLDTESAEEAGSAGVDDHPGRHGSAAETGPGTPTAAASVSVSRLTKSYGPHVAVRDVSFELTPGVTGLLGPNGAGKSTLVRCLAGLCGWDDGDVRIAGIDPARRAGDARGSVGFMPERVSFPPEMRVETYLRFAAEGKGVARAQRDSVVEAALRRAGLEGVRSRVIANLSKGYRQRVGLAQALLGDPPVLLLDEPSAGLDPLQMAEIRDVLRNYAKARVVLVSTHMLGEARVLCDRVLVMSQGRLVYDGSTTGMGAGGAPKFRVRVEGVGADGKSPEVAQPGTTLVECTAEDGHYDLVVEAEGHLPLGNLVARLSAAGWLVVGVEPAGDALEDAFRRAVRGAGTMDDAHGNGNRR